MTDYNEKSVEELRELAREREVEGRSKLTTKDDLVAALNESDGSEDKDAARDREAEQGQLGHASEASDPDNPEVVANLSPEGQEALKELTPEEKQLADLALDASGPLLLQSPSERVQTGAVNEAHAKQLEEKFKNVPDDFVGELLEDGTPLGRETFKGSGPNGEVLQEDVIDFPPPLGDRADRARAKTEDNQTRDLRTGTDPASQSRAALEAFPNEGPTIAQPRLYEQRGQLYTDGLSGQADHNVAMAYRLPDLRGGMFSLREGEETPQEAEKRKMEEDRTGENE